MLSLASSFVNAMATPATIGGGTWRVSLNVGREPGTYMPEDWASSGARLAFPVDVEFTTAAATQYQEDLLGEAEGTCRLRVVNPGKFIGSSGEVTVETKHGAWRATPTGAGGETHLRFFLDFPEDATRNDVVLPAGRLFFTTGMWQAEELELAQQAVSAADGLPTLASLRVGRVYRQLQPPLHRSLL